MELQGKAAIVTGAAGVIGRGVCEALIREGMKVAAADIAKDRVDSLAEDLKASGGEAVGVEVDVASADSTKQMVRKVIDTFGTVDALVNNAGVIAMASLVDTSEDDWDRVIDVNLKGAFLCARAVAPHLIQQERGRIINISSVAAKRPAGMMSAYAASKHGLIGLTQVWCQELGRFNITVNAVCPGFVESPMWSEQIGPAFAPYLGVDSSKVITEVAKTNAPLGRPQTPADIGQAVVYLCKADNVSGIALTVDGGHAMP